MNLIKIHNLEEYKNVIEHIKLSYSRYYDECATCMSWELRTPSEFQDPEIREIFKPNYSICDNALKFLGKCVIYSGHEIGVFRGIEITEEDFYYIVEDLIRGKETSMSCVGKIELLDPEIIEAGVKYGSIEIINNTKPDIAFINGALWMLKNYEKFNSR